MSLACSSFWYFRRRSAVLDQAALQQPGDERARPHEGVDDVDALVADGHAELPLQHVFNAADDVIHHLDGGVHYPHSLGHVFQGQLEKPLVQLGDDFLPGHCRGQPLHADAHVPVEAVQLGGFFLQSPLLQAFQGILHRPRHRVQCGKGVILEQGVEHRSGHQVLGEHTDGVIIGDAVVEVVADAGQETLEGFPHLWVWAAHQGADPGLVAP